jgi:N-formylglutamate amidohydrolase
MKPLFISIPHSGERIPAETPWLLGLPEPIVMCDVDRYVDRLYDPIAAMMKLTCVKTQWHRYVVDLNRLPEDIDVDSVQGSTNASGKFTTGLHWVKTTRGTRLMPEPMSQRLHHQLVERYFKPFHEDVVDTYAFFKERDAKKIFHLDCHSMPSKGTAAHKDPGETRADIVVSDWEGKSCEPAFKDLVMEAYSQTGLKVGYNWPYVGGRVTQTYGKPEEGQHAIQIEINRALYMDEETKQLLPDKAKILGEKLAQAIRTIHERTPELK